MDLIRNSQNIILYSHRKSGKSSLILKIFNRITRENNDITPVYIDLFGTLGEQDFINALFNALSQIEPRYKKLLKLIPGLKLSGGIDPITQVPTLSLSAEPVEKEKLLAQAMAVLSSYAEKQRVAVAFDEFQAVAGYAEKGFEKRLRSHIQHHDRISYIFAGSQGHILAEMFTSSKRAFYQSAQSFPLGQISKDDYIAWAGELFARKGQEVPEEILEDIVERCEYQPLYIQQFLYNLWKLKAISLARNDEIETMILNLHRNEYIGIFTGLTTNQKKALKLLAAANGEAIYTAQKLARFGFSNNSQLKRAVEALLEKELILKNGGLKIADVMFRKWVLTL